MIARVREDAPAVGITGIGAYVPDRIVSSEDVGAGLGVNADWIVERSGIRERRVAAAEEAASDLAVPAARQALERARVAPSDVGLVIVATASPDMPLPATASIVAVGARGRRTRPRTTCPRPRRASSTASLRRTRTSPQASSSGRS